MSFYIRPFVLDSENLIVNDGEECFKFLPEHLDEMSYLSQFSGKVIDCIEINNRDIFENEYNLIVPQRSNFISDLKVFSDIENNIEEIFLETVLSKSGKSLIVILFRDISNYLTMINKEYESDYVIGAFLINNIVHISNIYSKDYLTACLKCHFMNQIDSFDHDYMTDHQMIKFIKFAMRNNFGEISSKKISPCDSYLISSVLLHIIMSNSINGYNYKCNYTKKD